VSSSEGLRLEAVATSFDGRPVLRGITATVAPGELVALMGPNGSGKTTLLRAIVGLEPLTSGSVHLDGRDLGKLPTHRRGIGFLFQEPSLFPGRTVAQNLAYGPELAGWDRRAIDDRLEELAELLRIEPLLDRPSEALSGGERQRVALARTLAPCPKLVLLDEPFAAVDPDLRPALRDEFLEVLRTERVSVVHVTHDPEEGMIVGDRVLFLRDGRLAQLGTAEELLERPVDAEAARFFGYRLRGPGPPVIAYHPRSLEEAPGDPDAWRGRVISTRVVPGEVRVLVEIEGGGRLEWLAPERRTMPAPGAVVWLRPRRVVRYPDRVVAEPASQR
jgi:thiamine transport system ATP-binding protein